MASAGEDRESGRNRLTECFKQGLAQVIDPLIDNFQPDWPKLCSRTFMILAAALAVGLGIYWFCALKVLPFPYDFKGWAGGQIMHNALLLSQGRNFYVDPNVEPSSAYCYAPLLQMIIAPLILIFGPRMWVGRAVTMTVLVGIWVVMYIIGRRRTGKGLYGLASVGLLMSAYGVMSGHFDDIHPDGLMALWGLLSLLFAEKSLDRGAWLAAAVGCAVLSFFSKQPGASFIIGGTLFLLLHRPVFGLIYAGASGVLIALGMGVGQVLTDGQFWHYLIVTAGNMPLRWVAIPVYLVELAGFFIPSVLVLVTLSLAEPRSLQPTSPYTISFPLVFALGFTGGVRYGGSVTSVFPGLVLGALVLSFGLDRVREEWTRRAPVTAFLIYALLIAQTVALLFTFPAFPRPAHYRAAAHLGSLVRDAPGKVLVFYPISLAFENGRPVYDNAGVLYDQITWKDHSRLENQLRTGYFSRLLIPAKMEDLWLKEQPAYQYILQNYEIQEVVHQPPWFQVIPMKVYRRKAGLFNPTGTP